MSNPAPQRPTADIRLFLPDADAATEFAVLCALHLGAGDTVFLSGPVGAGKSHFARAVIRHFYGPETEVPSPSFTLVQCYSGLSPEIWHADLYRLSHASEVDELGLDDAMGTNLCLIEWPDRLAGPPPRRCLQIAFSFSGDGRMAQIAGASGALTAALQGRFSA